MTGSRISELPQADTPLKGDDLLAIVQENSQQEKETKQTKLSQLRQLSSAPKSQEFTYYDGTATDWNNNPQPDGMLHRQVTTYDNDNTLTTEYSYDTDGLLLAYRETFADADGNDISQETYILTYDSANPPRITNIDKSSSN